MRLTPGPTISFKSQQNFINLIYTSEKKARVFGPGENSQQF